MRTKLFVASVLALVVGVNAVWAATSAPAREQTAVVQNISGIMDTDVELTAIVYEGQEDLAQKAFEAAEDALRNVESLMSSHLADTDISRFNNAPAGEEVPMDPETLKVLKIARDYSKATGGVFDITCRPLLQLWKRAGAAGRLPTDQEMKDALALVGWDKITLTDKSATKLKDGVSLDLGGIAKKWGIDKAADAMEKQGLLGGIVNVGGDLRCFGQRKGGGTWQIGIKNPFAKNGELLATMSISGGAVCTSGNYERFVTIGGKQYSHIVDARTGKTADAIPSVTVFGKTAVESGIWGTTLSVTGESGFKLMPKDTGMSAMLIAGEPKSYKFYYFNGFQKLLNELPVEPLPPLTTAPTTKP